MAKNKNTIFTRTRLFAGTVLVAALALVGAGCGGSGLTPPEAATLEIWRTGDQLDSLFQITEEYKAVYPHVSFTIETFTESEYEERLLGAWAKGEGPDIFSVPNMRIGEYVQNGLVAPMPEAAALKRSVAEKSFGKTTVSVEARTVVFPTENQIRDQFANVVADDVVMNEGIQALPYGMDTLVMYYNRDLLARANVAVPPTTWTEFRNAVEAMVELDADGEVVLPAAALGTSNNVPHYFDIVSLLMMQNGAEMTTANGNAATFSGESLVRPEFFPGQEAVSFYGAFADEALRTYTWNAQQPDALESFTQGSLGFYFGYYGDKEVIEQRAPSLNFSFVKMPQVDPGNPVNYANYNVESVHVGSEHVEHSWNFIQFAASQENMGRLYEEMNTVPARKALIGELQEDPVLGNVAQQVLTAKSWYHGADPEEALAIFAEMIDDTNQKTDTVEAIVGLAAQKINLTLRR